MNFSHLTPHNNSEALDFNIGRCEGLKYLTLGIFVI